MRSPNPIAWICGICVTTLILLNVAHDAIAQELVQAPVLECLSCNSISEKFLSPEIQRLGNIELFFGIDGSKQPQDFGVNANLGIRSHAAWSQPLFERIGVGIQLGTAVVGSGNAVQVFELLGESVDRWQSFSTVGVFQRLPGGFSWGFAYDYLYQNSFDDFNLGQWRVRASQLIGASWELGATANLGSRSDNGVFNSTAVDLESIDQFHVYVRKFWPNQIFTTAWLGLSDGHSEENAITGTLPRKNDTVLFGADLYVPLTNHIAIYGETNMIFPADTGAVDAFLGFEFAPFGTAISKMANRYRPFLPVAGNPTFTTNLSRR